MKTLCLGRDIDFLQDPPVVSDVHVPVIEMLTLMTSETLMSRGVLSAIATAIVLINTIASKT